MVSIWIIIGLIISTISVSVLGAGFSVVGLAALFSGAMMAVAAMAISLEFAKFVLAAYVHQRWKKMNFLFKTYLLFAIVVLSIITSMGIFGFLSNAYQSASSVLDGENIKSESLKKELTHNKEEIDRLNRMIEEIPANRVSKRMKARAEQEPLISALNKRTEEIEKSITLSDLKILEVKQKVGPLIYIAKAFQMDLDSVVKYLIIIFVSVFDPLAICLVIAMTESLTSRNQTTFPESQSPTQPFSGAPPSPAEEVIQMRFVDEEERSAV